MRKISNNSRGVLVGPKIPKVLEKRQDIKSSLGEIQRLSYEIDKQFKINQESRSKIKIQQDSVNKQLIVSGYAVGQQEQEQQQRSKQRINEEYMFNTDNEELTEIERAIELSLNQYYKEDERSNTQNESDNNKQYGEYKMVMSFNKDLRQIIDNIESVRRSELISFGNSRDNIRMLQTESDILRMIKSSVITYNTINNNRQQRQQQQSNLLLAVDRLYTIRDTIQNKLQHLRDDVQYKKRIIQQLSVNTQRIEDDIQILSSRNYKLTREININTDKQSQHTSSEEQQQQNHHQKYIPLQHPTLKQQSQSISQQEYLSLMTYYQLYNPQTQSITSQFPKNKTQAIMLLNQLDQQISQLQLKKTLQLYNH